LKDHLLYQQPYLNHHTLGYDSKVERLLYKRSKDLKDAEEYVALSEVAIHNAKKLDTKENCIWPQSFGSKVYLLLLSILKS
jgi:hypothetical protein